MRRRFLLLALGALIFCASAAVAQPTFTIQNKKDACDGLANGSFEVLVSAATPPPLRVFIFGPPDQGPINAVVGTPLLVTGLPGGVAPNTARSYIVVVQDADGSSVQFVSIMTVGTALNASVTTAGDNSSCTVPNGFINLNVSGGSGSGYTYQWTGPNGFSATTKDISGLPGGPYSVTVFDNETNCSRTVGPITLTDPSPAIQTITTASPQPVCVGSGLTINMASSENGVTYEVIRNNSIATGITQIGNGGPLSFSIPAGSFSNGDNFKIRASNNFCTPTDMNGVVIVNIVPLPTATVTPVTPVCAGAPLPDVTFNFTGTAPFTFTYSNGTTTTTITNHATNSYTITNAAVGTYSITALTDANGCSATSLGGSTTVEVNPQPTASIGAVGPICTGDALPDVTITFTGKAPFSFTYTDGSNSVTINNHPDMTYTIPGAAVGTYQVTALTDANGCGGTDLGTPVNVVENPLPTVANVTGSATLCAGDALPTVEFTFTGTAPFAFTYTNGTTNTTVASHNSTTFSIANAAAGTYSVTALTDANGCAATDLGGNAIVEVNPLPTASIGAVGPVCAGDALPDLTITFTGKAPFSFTYTDGTNSVTINNHPDMTYTIPGAAVGTYQVTALTDANGCTGTTLGTPVNVVEHPLPTVANVTGSATLCAGAALPTVEFTFTGTAPFAFTYTNGTTNTTVASHNSTTFSIANAAAGTYSVTALTDANGCAATDLGGNAIVEINPLPTASIGAVGPVCAGDALPDLTITFTGKAPFSFTYTDGTNSVTINNHPDMTYTIPGAAVGTYQVTALTDANGCAGTTLGTPVNVVEHPLPTVANVTGSATLCAGDALPTVEFTFTGTAPFAFTYTNGTTNTTVASHNSTTFSIANAAAGTYSVTALTDANGCAATDLGGNAIVEVNPLPTALIGAVGPVCAGEALPDLTITFTGEAPFSFTYTDGTSSVTINNHPDMTYTIPGAAVGTYQVTALTDANGCTGTSLGTPVNVVEHPLPTVANVTGSATLCAGDPLPTVEFTFTGTAPFAFTYTNGTTNTTVASHNSTTFSIANAAAGTYSVTALTDANGCAATDLGGNAIIEVNPLPTASIGTVGPVCAGEPLPDLTITFTGEAPFSFTYTDGTNSVTINNHPDMTYTIPGAAVGAYQITALTDANGCTGTSLGTPVNVVEHPLPTVANVTGSATLCAGDPFPTVEFTFTGTAPFAFTYSNGTTNTTVASHNSTTFSIANAPAGTYSVTALTDANGCAATDLGGNAIIEVNPLPTASIGAVGPVCAGEPLPDLTITFTGEAPFSFTYNDGTNSVTINNHPDMTYQIPGALAGSYQVTALTDGNGCNGTNLGTPVNVIERPLPTVANVTGSATLCAGDALPTVEFTFTGTAPFAFTYSNGTTNTTVASHNSTTFSIPDAAAGTYSVTALTDANGCAAADLGGNAIIEVNPLPTASIGTVGPVCAGEPLPDLTITFTGEAPFSFTYTDGTNPVTINNHPDMTYQIPGAAAGTYQVTALTDANACPGTSLGDAVQVIESIRPWVMEVNDDATVCGSNPLPSVSFKFAGIAPFTFTYTDGTTPVTITDHPDSVYTIASAAAGVYSVTALTDSTGCTAIDLGGTATIIVTPAPVGFITDPGLLCAGDPLPSLEFNFIGTAPYTFTISKDGAVLATVPNHPDDIYVWPNAGAGTYTLTALSDGTGCAAADLGAPVEVIFTDGPSAVISGGGIVCNGGTPPDVVFTFTGTAPFDFTYTIDTDIFTINGWNSNVYAIADPDEGVYQITALTDASGCTTGSLGDPVAVGVNNTPPTVTAGPDPDPVCAGMTIDFPGASFGGAAVSAAWTVVSGPGEVNISDLTQTANPELVTFSTLTVGTYVLRLTTNDPPGDCEAASDEIEIQVIEAPAVDAGNSFTGCSGSVYTLSTASIGGSASTGTWSIVNQPAGGDGLLSSVAPTTNPGLATFSATVAGEYVLMLTTDSPIGSCDLAFDEVTITIINGIDPNLDVEAGTPTICSNGFSDITIENSQPGVSYQLRNDADDELVGTAVVGNGSTIILSTGPLTATTTFNILATLAGCTDAELTEKVTIEVTGDIATSFTVTAQDNTVCEGSSTNITLSNSETGIDYELRIDDTNAVVGLPQAGVDGTALVFPTDALTATTTFKIVATNGTCFIDITDKATVTVAPEIITNLVVKADPETICTGGTSTITVENSQDGITYQLRNDDDDTPTGAAVVGTGGTIELVTGALNATTILHVYATAPEGCPPAELLTKVEITVSGSLDDELPVAANDDPICSGEATTIRISNSEAGVNYTLRKDDDNAVIGTGVGNGGDLDISTGTLTDTTTFHVIASNGTCSIQLVQKVTVNVEVRPDTNLPLTAEIATLCDGGETNIKLENSQLGVTYQLRNAAGDAAVGAFQIGTGGTLLFPTGQLNATTTFYMEAVGGASCPVEIFPTTITIEVNGTLDATLAVKANPTSICEGSGVTIVVENSEAGVTYRLRNDANNDVIGTAVAGGGDIFLPTGNLNSTTTFNVLASNGTCSIELDNKVTVTVTDGPSAAIGVTANPPVICAGQAASITIVGSEVDVEYHLRDDATDDEIGTVVGNGGNVTISVPGITANTTFNVLAKLGDCEVVLTQKVTITVRAANDPICAGGQGCFAFSILQDQNVTQRPSCSGQNDGVLSWDISGVGSAFQVALLVNGVAVTPPDIGAARKVTFTNLSPASYTLSVTDNLGNTCTQDFEFLVETTVKATSNTVTNSYCFNQPFGVASLNVTGGNSPYEYSIDGGTTWVTNYVSGNNIENLAVGSYNILVRDDNTDNCPAEVSIVIDNEFPQIQYQVIANPVSTCGAADGSIVANNITGGSGVKQIRLLEITGGGNVVVEDFRNVTGTSYEFTNRVNGSYIVEIRDAVGCGVSSAGSPAVITSPGAVNYTVQPVDADCSNEGKSGAVLVGFDAAGTFEIGISTSQTPEPDYNTYNVTAGTPVILDKLSRGNYFVFVKPVSGNACPTVLPVSIDGAYAIDFDVQRVCFAAENPAVNLVNVQGQPGAQMTIQVFRLSDLSDMVDEFTAPTASVINITYQGEPNGTPHSWLVEPGSYVIKAFQNQAFCPGEANTPSHSETYTATQPLELVVEGVKMSLPEPRQTGGFTLKTIIGGSPMRTGDNRLYFVASLRDPSSNAPVMSDVNVFRNGQGNYEHIFRNLPVGNYLLVVTDENGCEQSSLIIVPAETRIIIPNIFTPNNDNVNDLFEIMNLPHGGGHKLVITNRWGKQVFSSNDYKEETFWDGEDAPDGIYFYRLQVSGDKVYTGWLEILRGSKP